MLIGRDQRVFTQAVSHGPNGELRGGGRLGLLRHVAAADEQLIDETGSVGDAVGESREGVDA